MGSVAGGVDSREERAPSQSPLAALVEARGVQHRRCPDTGSLPPIPATSGCGLRKAGQRECEGPPAGSLRTQGAWAGVLPALLPSAYLPSGRTLQPFLSCPAGRRQGRDPPPGRHTQQNCPRPSGSGPFRHCPAHGTPTARDVTRDWSSASRPRPLASGAATTPSPPSRADSSL